MTSKSFQLIVIVKYNNKRLKLVLFFYKSEFP